MGQGQPETGEFDFMNYLLGLQGTQPSVTPESLLAPGMQSPVAVGGPVPAPVPALADKPQKDLTKDPLQAMFANMPMPMAVTPAPVPMVAPKAVASQPGADAVATQTDVAKPLWTAALEGQMPQVARATTSSPVVPTTQGMLPEVTPVQTQSLAQKVDENGAPLEGFRLEATGVELSVSRQGQALAAKKYAVNAPAPKSTPVAEATVSESPKAELKARPQLEKAMEAPAPAATVQVAAMPEAKPETASKKESDRFSTLDVAPVLNAHKAESTSHVAETQSASGAPAPVAVPEVFRRVETLVQKGGGEMTVALDPPDLGKIEVKVKTSGNRVEIEMRSESVQAKNALESHFSELKSAMQTHDLHLAKLDVQVHRDPASFAQHSFQGMQDGRNASAQGGQNQGQGRSFSESNRKAPVVQSVPQVAMRPVTSVAGSGRVDLRI